MRGDPASRTAVTTAHQAGWFVMIDLPTLAVMPNRVRVGLDRRCGQFLRDTCRCVQHRIPGGATQYYTGGLDRSGDLGGSDSWEDAESCRHSGSIPRSCASAR
jgi:hypothetical protein